MNCVFLQQISSCVRLLKDFEMFTAVDPLYPWVSSFAVTRLVYLAVLWYFATSQLNDLIILGILISLIKNDETSSNVAQLYRKLRETMYCFATQQLYEKFCDWENMKLQNASPHQIYCKTKRCTVTYILIKLRCRNDRLINILTNQI